MTCHYHIMELSHYAILAMLTSFTNLHLVVKRCTVLINAISVLRMSLIVMLIKVHLYHGSSRKVWWSTHKYRKVMNYLFVHAYCAYCILSTRKPIINIECKDVFRFFGAFAPVLTVGVSQWSWRWWPHCWRTQHPVLRWWRCAVSSSLTWSNCSATAERTDGEVQLLPPLLPAATISHLMNGTKKWREWAVVLPWCSIFIPPPHDVKSSLNLQYVFSRLFVSHAHTLIEAHIYIHTHVFKGNNYPCDSRV